MNNINRFSYLNKELRDPNEDYLTNPDPNRFTNQIGVYNPDFWKKYNEINNCYSYACNLRVNEGKKVPSPGYCYLGREPTDSKEVIDGAKKDGIIFIDDLIEGCKNIVGTDKAPVWIVALFTYSIPSTGQFGYHWFRKVYDKENGNQFWANKFFTGKVTNIGVNGNIILDPEVESKKMFDNQEDWQNYMWHGYFLVPNGISTPESQDSYTRICNENR
ncbi:hypothetical protein [Xenorhabdus bovienii]|uniref:hypothetical protein n=1 Tax=Xenorhabdus bovienii TaxID=40576 RepID=UPI003DA3CCF1